MKKQSTADAFEDLAKKFSSCEKEIHCSIIRLQTRWAGRMKKRILLFLWRRLHQIHRKAVNACWFLDGYIYDTPSDKQERYFQANCRCPMPSVEKQNFGSLTAREGESLSTVIIMLENWDWTQHEKFTLQQAIRILKEIVEKGEEE